MWWLLTSAWAVETGAMSATLDGATLTELEAGGQDWLSGTPTLAHGVDGLDALVTAESLPDGQLLFRLDLTNTGDQLVSSDVTFPYIPGLGTGTELSYVFPAVGPIVDDQTGSHVRYYGGLFPMQWMEVHTDDGGLWLMSRDTNGSPKTFKLTKTSETRATLSVIWPGLEVEPGGTVTLEAALGVHDTTWHEALAAYRRWVSEWYRPAVRRDPAFREAFHVRQIHLHENAVLGDHPGAFQDGTWSLQEAVDTDIEAFGGVDWVHVFDWGMDFIHGRVGDYNPYPYLGDPQDLRDEVDALQDRGIGVGLYVEGVLLDTTSLTGLRWGDAWELENSSGEVYTDYAPSWHVCADVPEWQEHMALRNARRTQLRVGPDGLYVDQFGFGYQYACHRTDHDHGVPSAQIQAEWELMQAVREASSPAQILYSESVPADVATQTQDGAFTESITSFRYDSRTVPVSLVRFGLPDFKTIQLLTQDAPLADDVEGVRLTFFNGEAQRLMGYADWFDEATLIELRISWRALTSYRKEFTSSNPLPLVQTPAPDVHANAFPTEDSTLWTLFNSGDETTSGVVLEADAIPGSTWTDCWNDTQLEPEILNGLAQIELDLAPGEVGCIVQEWTRTEPTLVAHWELDAGEASAHERLGSATRFDEALDLGEQPDLDALTADFSVAAWVRPDELGGVQRILASEGWSSGGWLFGLTETGGQPAVVLTTIGVQDHVVRAVVPAESWTHLAAVVDAGSTVTLYVDGHPRGTVQGSQPARAGTSTWHLGGNGIDGSLAGALDDVRVYDGALSVDEVRALADITPPMAGSIRAADTTVPDVEIWWSGFHDAGSGIASYTVTVGDEERVTTDLIGTFAGLDGAVDVSVTAVDAVGLTTTVSATLDVDAGRPPLLGRFDSGDSVEAELFRGEAFSVVVDAGSAGPLIGWEDSWSLERTAEGVELDLVDELLSVPVESAGELTIVFDRWSDLTVHVDGVLAGTAPGTLPAPATTGVGAVAVDGLELYDGVLRPTAPDDSGLDSIADAAGDTSAPTPPEPHERCGCRSGSAVLLLGLGLLVRRRR
ncbi:MAG: LamG domain-containing protein [Proteobacteria bacterium]|nr:LamG domain-containing protein [Pseudomonadota bacterium]MCP4921069.1 LamG domain-containing protein [Pseudomonadota bacterium]